MSGDFLDVVLVSSLAVLSFSFLIFLFYFVPVLIQITKTFEALQSLLNITKHTINDIGDKFKQVSEKAGSLQTKIKSVFAGLKAGIENFVGK